MLVSFFHKKDYQHKIKDCSKLIILMCRVVFFFAGLRMRMHPRKV